MDVLDLGRFAARRFAAALVVLLIVTTSVFFLVHIAPGSPVDTLVRGINASPELRATVSDRYQLDEPLPAQFVTYLGNVLTGDFGESYRTREGVVDAVADRLGVTVPLIVFAFLVTLVVGTALGLLAALRRGTAIDRAIVGFSILGASAPPFAVAIVLLYVFAVGLGWFPVIGEWEGPLGAIWHLTLPAVALAVGGIAPMLKIVRTAVVRTLEEEHVLFARARGLSRRQVLVDHVLRNASIHSATTAGVLLVGMIAAVALVELPFSLDGVGAYFVRAVTEQDIPVIQALTLMTTAAILMVNFLVDLLYFLLDPRLQVRARPS